jgi:hypothetical protein
MIWHYRDFGFDRVVLKFQQEQVKLICNYRIISNANSIFLFRIELERMLNSMVLAKSF